MDPSNYYDACVSDSCACDSGGDCECFCTAVAAYAAACNEAGACVAWRTPRICRKSPIPWQNNRVDQYVKINRITGYINAA